MRAVSRSRSTDGRLNSVGSHGVVGRGVEELQLERSLFKGDKV